jgi:ATP-dependent Lon protease
MVHFSYADKRRLLETGDVSARLALLAQLVEQEIARARIGGEVLAKTQASIDRSRRTAFLREQLSIIQQELDALDPAETEIDRLEQKVDAGGLPPPVAEDARREMQRLHDSAVRLREGSAIRTYVDWVLSMPWNRKARDRCDLRRARRILHNRYFDLGSARDLLLEYLAVRKLRGGNPRPLLAIMGPPGTGRTSLASTVARILGRPFIRVPMQGVRDETDIFGSPRTDTAARPGRILDGLREAGVRNPVMLMDEIDRLETGEGETMLALLEALHPERNSRFRDRYLNIPFDLSDVLFVITGKVAEEIPDALKDIVYIIELTGYTERIKLAIANEYIWPATVEDHGLMPNSVRLTGAALRKIVRSYTREAGIHDLKSLLRKICRRSAMQIATGRHRRVSIHARNLEKYLGKPIYGRDHVGRGPKIGIVTGLAWTEDGGDLLPIEALLMPGAGMTTLTGLLGEVLEESVEAARSYVRSRAKDLKISQDLFDEMDLHVHFPEGAIPKDGPSAGIAAATTIASLLSKRPVRDDIAMTGEISLQGRVLAVGGVREKVLAAYRAGIKHIILPKSNESELAEVPTEVRGKMKFHLVSEVSEVFKLALLKKRKAHR